MGYVVGEYVVGKMCVEICVKMCVKMCSDFLYACFHSKQPSGPVTSPPAGSGVCVCCMLCVMLV